jgi:hypothetical protein
MATTAAEIQALYIAYFNRPADPVGLTFWLNAANAAGSTAAVANAFSASDEYKVTYAGKSYPEIVDALYVNLFGRHAEADGLIFWSNALQSGQVNIGNIAVAIQGGAQNADKISVDNKVLAASAFTTAVSADGASIVGYTGAAANQVARDWLSTVTDPTSLETAIGESALDAVAASVIAAHDATTNVGTSFSLTGNTDTVLGTALNDTINVGLTDAAATTLTALDSIDGGAGIDTLNVENTGGVNALAGTIKNIEIINFKGAGAVNGGGTIAAPTGTTAINFVSTDDATLALSGLTKQVIGLNAVVDATVVTAGYAAAQTSASVAATGLVGDATVNLTGAGLTKVAVAVDGTAAGKSLTVDGATVTSATVVASGASTVILTGAALSAVTVSGKGAVDLTGTSVELETLTATAAVGGVTYVNTGSTTEFSAATGAGDDVLTLQGDTIATVTTGVGDDTVTIAGAATAATTSIDLGAGDDTLNLGTGLTKGVTLIGGEGTDTIAATYAGYGTFVTAFDTAASLAKLTGFESLSITDVLADTNELVLGKIAGVTSAQLAGVATGGTATVSDIGAAGTIVLKGDLATNDGALVLELADATGKSDVLNLVADTLITQDNDGTVDVTAATITITASGVETVNFTSTGTLDTDVTTGNKTDVATNTLVLEDTAVTTVNISGNQKAVFAVDADSEVLATINGATNTAGVTVDGANASVALTITGSATAANTLGGGAKADTITGGAKADTIFGGAGADKLAGGAGNDTFSYTAATQSTLASTDTISDFTANTYGNGTSGAAGTGAAVDTTKWTGDVLSFDVDTAVITKVAVGVYTNAVDASIFIQNTSDASTDTFVAALDSSTSKLYLDWNSDGTVDSVINLTGVTTLTAAAFVLV